jgi:hypothetical protein
LGDDKEFKNLRPCDSNRANCAHALRAASAAAVRIENDLLRSYENLIVANASFEMWKAVGNCGCKSAEIGYSVYVLVDGNENCVIGGKVGAMQSRQARLVVDPDRRDDDSRHDIKLELSCVARLMGSFRWKKHPRILLP